MDWQSIQAQSSVLAVACCPAAVQRGITLSCQPCQTRMPRQLSQYYLTQVGGTQCGPDQETHVSVFIHQHGQWLGSHMGALLGM